MRVYLPASPSDLRALLDGRPLDSPRTGFAVTRALAAWAAADGPVDDEEAELVAATEAARASLRLLDPVAPRRMVVAVEVPGDAVAVEDDGAEVGPGRVSLRVGVRLGDVAAVLVDDPAAGDDVVAAGAALEAADRGDAGAERTLTVLEEHDLLWYDPSELGGLLER